MPRFTPDPPTACEDCRLAHARTRRGWAVVHRDGRECFGGPPARAIQRQRSAAEIYAGMFPGDTRESAWD